MKKFIPILLLISILIAGPCFGATVGTVTCTDYVYNGLSGKPETRVITYTVTFGDAAASPANVTLHNIVATAYNSRETLRGWWLWKINTTDAATGPTEDTDFYLWSVEDKHDVLGGNGVDSIDNASDNTFYPATVSQALTGEEIFDIDNNAVNDAGTVIIFHLYR